MQRFIPLLHMQGWIELLDDLASDRECKSGKVSCNTHLVFIAGLPKFGTTWLEQLLICAPRMVQLNISSLRGYPHFLHFLQVHPNDIVSEMLNCAPRDKLSFLKLHVAPTSQNIGILYDQDVKPTILLRDIRDMLVSRYYHVITDVTHWDHQRLMSVPDDMRFLESLKGVHSDDSMNVIDYFVFWISGWIDRAEADSENMLVVRYEDLNLDTFFVLRKVFGFYGYRISDDGINDVITKQKTKCGRDQKRGLRENFKQRGRAWSTFRKGAIGGWSEIFDQQIKDYVKEHAGQMLIKAGYEKDFYW